MNIKEAKRHIVDFVRYKDDALIELLDNLDKAPVTLREKSIEVNKLPYRLFSRFIDLSESESVIPLNPNHDQLCQKVSSFISSLELDETLKLRDLKPKNKREIIFTALFDIFAYFINYREMTETYQYYLIYPFEDLRTEKFQTIVREFVSPIDRAHKTVWDYNLHNCPSNVEHLIACHIYLYRLFYYALYLLLEIPLEKDEPTLSKIKVKTLDFLDSIHLDKPKYFLKLIMTRKNSAALLALYEIICIFNSLPRPNPPEPPSVVRQIINMFRS